MITVNNLVLTSPMDVWKDLDELYGKVSVPEEAIGPEDLSHISKLIGWCTNQRAYLLSLSAFAEVETKRINRSGPKEAYQDMVSKKNIIKTYLDLLKGIYDASSRQLTIYQNQKDEFLRNSRGDLV